MNIPYQDLQKLVSDLRFIMQTGGNPLFMGGGSQFWDRFMYMNSVLKSLLLFLVLILALYIVYLLAFRGYPKILFDIASLSFFRKENVDKFLDNRGFMFKHLKQLHRSDWGCYNPHLALGEIYGYTPSLASKTQTAMDLMQTHYGKLRYEDRMREMFREYFLFYNRVNINRTHEAYSWIEYSIRNPGKPIPMMNSPEAVAAGKVRMTPRPVETPTVIHFVDFYETMVEYKKQRGLLSEKDFKLPYDNRRRKNDEELMIEMYVRDRVAHEQGKNTYELKRVKSMNQALREVALECQLMVQRVREVPVSMYLLLPTGGHVAQQFKMDFDPRKELVLTGKIYDDRQVRYSDVNEYSWFLFEVLQSLQASQTYSMFRNQWEQLLQKAGPLSTDTRTLLQKALIGYLNLPLDKRVQAEIKLPLSYPSLQKYLTREVFSFVNKHPIFIRVHLSWMVETAAMDRKALYERVIKAYIVLMQRDYRNPSQKTTQETEMVINLWKNGDAFQMLINAVNVMDLYLNDYRIQLTKLYEEHYITNQQFFMALWKPYVCELWTERIVERYKRTFSWGNIKRSWHRFRYTVWGYGFFGNPKTGLGKLLYDLSGIIWKAFTTKPPPQKVPEPAPNMSGPTPDALGGFGG